MTTIGYFRREGDGFIGHVDTLALDLTVIPDAGREVLDQSA
ncbi:hypothetical protein ACRAWD_05450 [Caulobacter segnis]